MSTFYAVRVGHNPGIYTEWAAAEKQVRGYSSAEYKKFSTETQAEAYLQVPTVVIQDTPVTIHEPRDQCVVFTDGSGGRNGGFGVVIRGYKDQDYYAYGCLPPTFTVTNNVAELYAIYIALSLVQGDVTLYTDSEYARLALTKHAPGWIKNGWKLVNGHDVANQHVIKPILTLMAGREVRIFHVEAHSGVPDNELADQLATRGAHGTELLKAWGDVRR